MAEMKRFNMKMPQELYDEIEAMANERGVTVTEVMRRFIKLGLIAAALEGEPDSALIMRIGNKETEVILV